MVPKMPWTVTVNHTAIYLLACTISNVACTFPLDVFSLDLKAANPSMHKSITNYGSTALIIWFVLIGSISYATGLRSASAHSRYWLSATAGFLTATASWVSIALGWNIALFLSVLFLPAVLAVVAGKWAARSNPDMQPTPGSGAAASPTLSAVSRTAQSIRITLEYLLFAGCALLAAIYFLGAVWVWVPFSTCAQAFLAAAPSALLVAAASVFVTNFQRGRLIFFSSTIAAALALFAIVSAGGAGICSERFSVGMNFWPFAALALVGARMAFVAKSGARRRM